MVKKHWTLDREVPGSNLETRIKFSDSSSSLQFFLLGEKLTGLIEGLSLRRRKDTLIKPTQNTHNLPAYTNCSISFFKI